MPLCFRGYADFSLIIVPTSDTESQAPVSISKMKNETGQTFETALKPNNKANKTKKNEEPAINIEYDRDHAK